MSIVDRAGAVVLGDAFKGGPQLHVFVLCLVRSGFALALEALDSFAEQATFAVPTLQLILHFT